jgi:hypothetical protein
MLLSKADIDELKSIHQKECGQILSDAEVRDMGRRLLQLYELLTCPPATQAPDSGEKPFLPER